MMKKKKKKKKIGGLGQTHIMQQKDNRQTKKMNKEKKRCTKSPGTQRIGGEMLLWHSIVQDGVSYHQTDRS